MELRPGTPKEAGMLPEQIDRARDLCAGWVKSGHTPAIVALVARRGVIVLHEAFGKLRPEADSPPVRLDTIFPIMSITKPMTATLVMYLVEDGLLGLNRPVVDYLPEWTAKGADEVLVHHLLTHTSGFDDFAFFEAYASDFLDIERRSLEEYERRLLDRLYALPLEKEAGEEMDYSFLIFNLLGKIIERVSGLSFADFAEERLFSPLGMDDTWLVVPEAVRPRIVKRPPDAPGTKPIGPVLAIDSRLFEEIPMPSGGAFSTARDVAVFGQTILNGGSYGPTRILSRPAVAAMTRNQTPGVPARTGGSTQKESSYGYGWFISSNERWKYWDGSLPSPGEFHHQGAGGTLLWVDPANEIVGVYFSIDLAQTTDFEPLWNADLFQNVVTSAVED